MTLLSTLAPSSVLLSSSPAEIGGRPNGRVNRPAVPAVERTRGHRDALHEHSRRTQGRPSGPQGPGIQDQETQGSSARTFLLPRERDHNAPDVSDTRSSGAQTRGDGFSSPFLAQVLSQGLELTKTFITEHRDAATHGSEAYRQAGAAPPAYSHEPTLFSFAI